MSEKLNGVRVAIGSIGDDIHVVGITILGHALRNAGAEVIQLGVQTLPEEFVAVAVSEDVDALFVSSSNGHAAHFCEHLRQDLLAAEVTDCLLYAGGNLAVSAATTWGDVEARFKAMGFDRVYPAGTTPVRAIDDLRLDIASKMESSWN